VVQLLRLEVGKRTGPAVGGTVGPLLSTPTGNLDISEHNNK
jgi:hypothetical protein